MYLFFSLIPATIWLTLGYFTLFTSTRAQGPMQMFGLVLTVWVFVIAALFPMIGAYLMFAGVSPIGEMIQQMHSGMSSWR